MSEKNEEGAIERATRPSAVAFLAARVYLVFFLACLTVSGVRVTWWLTSRAEALMTGETVAAVSSRRELGSLEMERAEIAALDSGIALCERIQRDLAEAHARGIFSATYADLNDLDYRLRSLREKRAELGGKR